MKQHTPGPWEVWHYAREIAVEAPCGRVLYCQSHDLDDCVEADANLIAAAPDLLTALREMVVYAEWTCVTVFVDGYEAAMQRALEALAKAGA
jgi:hypothetical protein